MGERRFPVLHHSHSLVFLFLLTWDILGGGFFLKLVHFRALSGWESELSFDSLASNWRWVNEVFLFLNGTALAGVFLSFFVEGLYRFYGQALALLFLADLAYPNLLAL